MPPPGCTLDRDDNGVPHLAADSEADLYRGLGWIHGRDRPLQVLLTRMAAWGRLAEHLPGADLLAADRAFRRMGLHLGAGAQVAALPDDVSVLLDAYCDGLNRALGSRPPWELRMLGLRRVEEWRGEDCVVLARLVGFVGLAQSQGEMERLLVQLVRSGVPRGHLDELFPRGLDGLDTALVASVEPGEPVVPASIRWNRFAPRPLASNNWAVAPSRTASRRAILSSDPHLELRLPAIWSEVVARWEGRWVAGATMPGLPGFLVARTDTLAWGPTYAFMDSTDSWVEQCRGGKVRRDVDGEQTWVPTRRRVERIAVRHAPPVTLDVHETDRGVLDGDPVGGMRLATRWSGAGGGAASMTAVVNLLRASDVDAGREAIGGMEMAFNWVLADAQGSIAYQMSGLLPLRAKPAGGLAPLPAWDPTTAWRGFADPADLPRDRDPERGFLATANNDLNGLGRVPACTLPMGESRSVRIAEVLGSTDAWTIEDSRRLQTDLVAAHPRSYLAVLVPLLPEHPNTHLLRDWDCSYDPGSRGATLFERWYRALIVDVFGSALGEDVVTYLLDQAGVLTDFYDNVDGVLLRERSAWFEGRTRDEVYRRVAEVTVPGPVPEWGEVHATVVPHMLFSGTPLARLGFERGPFPLPGGRGSVQQGQLYRLAGRATSFVPTLRLVTDFAEDAAHTALAGGPVDRVRSRWYASGLEPWRLGRLKVLRP